MKLAACIHRGLLAAWLPGLLLALLFAGCSKPNLEATDLETGMNLVLSEAAFQKIKNKRDSALKLGMLFKSDTDYVAGVVRSNGKEVPVKARLKGDYTDHLLGSRWSFRIVAKGGRILHHRKISVQGIYTRGYLHEWVYHEMLKEENLIHLQYRFFPFCVNDTLCGIYALESHFDSHLLEMANRPPGPIMKFDEEGFWDNAKFPDLENREDLLVQHTDIVVTNKKWAKKEENQALLAKGVMALDDFRKGKRPASEVFDLEVWARYIAVTELNGSIHPLRWHNMRFYYNPSTQKIEPIGFDCNSNFVPDKPLYQHDPNQEFFHRMMLEDEHFHALLKPEMLRISKQSYVDAFFDRHQATLSDLQELLRQEKEGYTFYSSVFDASRQRMENLLNAQP